MNNVFLAFGLTLIAGLSTGIGSTIAFFANKTNTKFLTVSLGFSAGVMIYVSFVDIFQTAKTTLTQELSITTGSWVTVVSFFGGMLLIALIDKLVPSADNPHSMYKVEEIESGTPDYSHLMRLGLTSAIAVALHNFPEGIATFISAMREPSVALPITVAVALHNIPEGIAVSVPIYYATGSKRKAFLYSFLSGLSEPIGALIAYLILMPFLNEVVFGIIFAAVAGIMVYISLDELLPSAEKYGEHHLSIYGLVAGMGVMAISLLLFI